MRLWLDSEGAVLDDAQVLRMVSCAGGLAEAVERYGDVRLIETKGTRERGCASGRRALSSYLAEEEAKS